MPFQFHLQPPENAVIYNLKRGERGITSCKASGRQQRLSKSYNPKSCHQNQAPLGIFLSAPTSSSNHARPGSRGSRFWTGSPWDRQQDAQPRGRHVSLARGCEPPQQASPGARLGQRPGGPPHLAPSLAAKFKAECGQEKETFAGCRLPAALARVCPALRNCS